MAFNGSGTFLINTAGQPVVSGTVISSTAFNALTADLATGLSTAITKDGQTTVTANIPMSTYKFTGLGVGSAATDSANLSQVQSTVTKLLNSVSGADTITATASPTLAAYAAGQMFYFVAAGDNTTSVTLNIDSLGAKAVTRDGSTALVAADIKSGEVIVVVYDGTRFQVVSQLNSAGNATFANVSITSALNVGGVATFSAGTAAAPSITTTGDTNTGIFFPAADTIAFTEGGTESLRVNSSGNMGIGTTSPTNTAGFSRQLQIEGTTAALTLSGTTGTGKYTLGVPGANAVGLWDNTASAYRWYVDSSGNLGIGTASPGNRLDVLTGVEGDSVVLNNNNSNVGAANTFGYIVKEAGSNRITLRYRRDGSATSELIGVSAGPFVFGTSNTEGMRLTSGGDLAVGLTAPSARLHARVVADTESQIAQFENLNVAGTDSHRLQIKVDASANSVKYESTGSSAGSHIFVCGNDERARLDSSGNLGIGTTTMTGKLNVNGDIRTAGGGDLRLSNNGDPSITADDTFLYNDAKNLIVWANGSERARITSGGDLLVGLTTGSYHILRKAVTNDGGNTTVEFQSTGGSTSQIWYGVSGFNANAANAATKVGRDATTLRSINAGGTVNASGADYAEYMTKAGDFALAKGDVCGINADGKLTNVFANAISFVVKSTDPSYVGGDSWGAEFKDDPEGLEAARQKVDRIAFAGQVPVNVLGATPGQYIVPINDNGAIKGVAVSNPTFEQYQSAVGKVIAVQDDGRALIIVKVA